MSIPSPTPILRHATAALLLVASAGAANAQSTAGGAVAGVHSHPSKHKSGTRGTANQPAPAEHQAVQPSQRLPDEPNQVKEQVAPTPEAPVKPGSVPAPGQDTPKPQLR